MLMVNKLVSLMTYRKDIPSVNFARHLNGIKTPRKVHKTVQLEESYFNVFLTPQSHSKSIKIQKYVTSVISIPLFLTLNSVTTELL